MIDIAFDKGELVLKNGDLIFVEKSEAIMQELYIFLNIRACHRNKKGKIIFNGELDFDQEQGIDFVFVTDSNTTDSQIKNHYIKKIRQYYNKYITEINNFNIVRDNDTRTIIITFDYITIYSDIKQVFKVEVIK